MTWKDKKTMDRGAAGRLLEMFGRGIVEGGTVDVAGSQVALPERFDVELEFKEKHGGYKFEIEFKWRHAPERTLSESGLPIKETRIARIAAEGLLPGRGVSFAYPSYSDRAILIVLPDGGLRAYSATCPHKGETVIWDEVSKRLCCPAHGAVFDPENGAKLEGPGGPFLRKIAIRIEGKDIFAVGIERHKR